MIRDLTGAPNTRVQVESVIPDVIRDLGGAPNSRLPAARLVGSVIPDLIRDLTGALNSRLRDAGSDAFDAVGPLPGS